MVQSSSQIKYKYLTADRAFGGFKEFSGVSPSLNNDTDGIVSNGKFTALPWERQGTVAVLPAYDFRRLDNTIPLIVGHKGAVTDTQFSHHNDNLLGTSSEDGSLRLWLLEDEGLTENLRDADATLNGHTKKVLGFQWHHIVENTIASYSFDNTVRIWDVEAQANTMIFDGITATPTCLRWSPKGDQIGLTCKQSHMVFFDPRKEGSTMQAKGHDNTKPQKLAWVDDSTFFTTGYSNIREREYMVWDQRNLSEAVAKGSINKSNGIGHIYFDQQHHLLYLAGRGDSNVEIFKYNHGAAEPLESLFEYKGDNTPQRGFFYMPKQSCDVTKHEVGRAVRLSSKGQIHYLGFRLPNKFGNFMQELYPEFPSQTPGAQYSEWAAGEDKPAVMDQLKESGGATDSGASKKNFLNKLKKAPAAEPTPAATAAPVEDPQVATL